LDRIDINGTISISIINNRLVNDDGDYVALRFRLDIPSHSVFIAVEDTNNNILSVPDDAYDGALDVSKNDINDDQ
jgi:hypothetical protein